MSTSVPDRAVPDHADSMADSKRTASQQAFALWSQVYDDQLNPLLSLEQRFLARMLPDVRGLNVLDAGCGTGRWLPHLASQSPGSLVGIDASPEMLARASAKSIPNADLRLADCTALPVRNSSTDLAIVSFVLGNIHDLEKFAKEMARIARPNANVFLTDMHPETASFRNWKQSFKANGVVVEIEARLRPLEQIVSVFHAFGFETLSLLQPCFGMPERHIFEHSRKLEIFDFSSGLPAIYILQMKKIKRRGPRCDPRSGDNRQCTDYPMDTDASRQAACGNGKDVGMRYLHGRKEGAPCQHGMTV